MVVREGDLWVAAVVDREEDLCQWDAEEEGEEELLRDHQEVGRANDERIAEGL